VQVIDFSTLYVYIIAYLHTFVNTKYMQYTYKLLMSRSSYIN
jgi:hypothetical protein